MGKSQRENIRTAGIKNPMKKRIFRELKQEKGKNIAIFLFLSLTIGFISGFLVADNSMQEAYNESFTKYHIEDGNFEISEKAEEALTDRLEALGIQLFPNFYIEKEVKKTADENGADRKAREDVKEKKDEIVQIRVFNMENRRQINQICLMKGRLPEKTGEIAIDRLFAVKNHLKPGKTMNIAGTEYQVTGLLALSDYSALFRDNGEFMFDATHFGVGVVTEQQFKTYENGKIYLSYSWKNKEAGLSDKEKEELSEKIRETLVSEQAGLINFMAEKDNQAIHFTGNDMGSDKGMVMVLLYLIMGILAFIIAVTTTSTVERESAVIGTLRASGYTRGEMLLHYMISPLIVTLIASVVGNILGYSWFKNFMAGMYYNSYSLTTYHTLWNAEAFLITTVIPATMIMVINFIVLGNKMRMTPLQFLKKDWKKKKNIKAVRLPAFRFMTRFQLRVILQNIPNYLILFVGIYFASVLALFGLMMLPLLDHSGDEILKHMKGEYQYILKQPVQTENEEAEAIIITSLMNDLKGTHKDEVTVYGIGEDSVYFQDIRLSETKDSVVVSEAVLEKYRLKIGEKLKFKSEFTDKSYEFIIADSYDYPQGLAVFMKEDLCREIFELPEGYFNAYLSQVPLEDIDEKMIITRITRTDMMKVTTQLKDSFGGMMPLLAVFATGMSVLIIYLLSKVVIEKNTNAISMVKILGYQNREISRLYVNATGVAAMVSALISIPLSYGSMKYLYNLFMRDFNGWVSYYIQPLVIAEVLSLTVIAYLIVAAVLIKKIKKIPMDQVLKNID